MESNRREEGEEVEEEGQVDEQEGEVEEEEEVRRTQVETTVR